MLPRSRLISPRPINAQATYPLGAAGVCHKVKGTLIRLLSAVDLAALDHGPRLMGESLCCHQQVPGLQRFFGRRLQQVDRLTGLPRGEPCHCHPELRMPADKQVRFVDDSGGLLG